MHKVLVITYYWPPAGGPGSLRMVKLARYLPAFGIRPVLLTVKDGEYPYTDSSLGQELPENLTVYRSRSMDPFSIYKSFTGREKTEPLAVGLLTLQKKNWKEKLAALIRLNFFIPDARIGWALFSLWKAFKVIKSEKIKCLFSSSPPHSLQVSALILKKMTGLKWVADLRDPWTDIRYYQYSRRCRLAASLDRMLERMVLSAADHVITVSHPVGSRFQEKVKFKRLNMTVIPNGYDEAEFAAPETAASAHFLVLHTGNMLENQNPSVLWKSIARLILDRPHSRKNIRIRLVGRVAPMVLESAAGAGIDDLVETRPFMPHQQIIEEMKRASILLVVIPCVRYNEGIVTGKLFEYIGSARPILVIGPMDGEAGAIARKISNSTACGYDEDRVCYEFLCKNYAYWSRKRVPCSTQEERRIYSRFHQVKKIADLLSLP